MAAATKRNGAGDKDEGAMEPAADEKQECFIMMPFSDGEKPKGHFRRVLEDVFEPACALAGYTPFRGDAVRQTNLIHLDILQRVLNTPMALCDLSSRNPNVMFELGLRQAFDMPVVLVREVGTPDIFDVGPLRYYEYRPTLGYREVLEDQKYIAAMLVATRESVGKEGEVNSLVKLLALAKSANLPELKDAEKDPVVRLVRAELEGVRAEISGWRHGQEENRARHYAPGVVRASASTRKGAQSVSDEAAAAILNKEISRHGIEYATSSFFGLPREVVRETSASTSKFNLFLFSLLTTLSYFDTPDSLLVSDFDTFIKSCSSLRNLGLYSEYRDNVLNAEPHIGKYLAREQSITDSEGPSLSDVESA